MTRNAVLLTAGLALACPVRPDPVIPDVARYEWELAVAKLEQVASRARAVQPERFHYFAHLAEGEYGGCAYFTRGDTLYYGFFSLPRSIHYCIDCPRVLRHEFGHAILYALGDPYYPCWEHGTPNRKDIPDRLRFCPDRYLYPK